MKQVQRSLLPKQMDQDERTRIRDRTMLPSPFPATTLSSWKNRRRVCISWVTLCHDDRRRRSKTHPDHLHPIRRRHHYRALPLRFAQEGEDVPPGG